MSMMLNGIMRKFVQQTNGSIAPILDDTKFGRKKKDICIYIYSDFFFFPVILIKIFASFDHAFAESFQISGI